MNGISENTPILGFEHRQATYNAAANQLCAVATRHPFGAAITADVTQLREDLAHFTVFVPLVGGFSTGKSSLLNGWLGESLLPTAIQPTTDCAWALHYVPDPSAERQFEIFDASGKTVVWRDIWRHHPTLARFPHLILVDMPGLGSSNHQHEQAVAYVMPKAVAFVVCVVSTKPLTSDILHFLQDKAQYGLPTVALLTQYDLLPPSERAAVLNHLHNQLASAFVEVLSIGQVSARHGDLAAWEIALEQLNDTIPAVFEQRFRTRLKQQAESLQTHLRWLSNPRDDNAASWEREAMQLADRTARFQDHWGNGHQNFLQIGVPNAAIQSALRISQHLDAQQSSLVALLVDEQDVQSAIRDALATACQRYPTAALQQEFRTQFASLIGDLNLPDHALKLESPTLETPAFTTSWIAQIAGFVANVIGYRWPIIGAILKSVADALHRQREQAARQAIRQFLQQLQNDLPAQLHTPLQSLAEQWVASAKARCDAELTARQARLAGLQADLDQDAARRTEIQHQRQADLHLLNHLIATLDSDIPPAHPLGS